MGRPPGDRAGTRRFSTHSMPGFARTQTHDTANERLDTAPSFIETKTGSERFRGSTDQCARGSSPRGTTRSWRPEPNTVHAHDLIPGSLLTLYDHVIRERLGHDPAHQPVPDSAAKPGELPLRVAALGRCIANRLTEKPAFTRRAVLPLSIRPSWRRTVGRLLSGRGSDKVPRLRRTAHRRRSSRIGRSCSPSRVTPGRTRRPPRHPASRRGRA
jgi:hypothetical protein